MPENKQVRIRRRNLLSEVVSESPKRGLYDPLSLSLVKTGSDCFMNSSMGFYSYYVKPCHKEPKQVIRLASVTWSPGYHKDTYST